MLTTTNDKARVHPASPHHRGRPWRNDCSRHVHKIRLPSRLCKDRCSPVGCALPREGRLTQPLLL